ncbi:uncharacterized protein MONOS_16201 [Monocercomonoides exilis]|uniref:uncharacterized protein n=1 Tax=Monocercomonoides exilis TaxID=2049356 RepID=UPI00355AC17D|nr:hypothetical protein MONOS_16201 [Monocercomonoides exilis]|eukprot:MONOS_16201.1-p1 / transcript=MONOS_16201.1 / gene=MONOS_16201 / organism=Monocercomonoides_exilis_PA203 / gene_product=unspecified product / transcript_product=unspecified product / location=Mono_scaffold01561:3474-4185(+) / protein_length=218 / sequence_SO=supercontig / SO=protein_coding / is_pseudo=false
MDSFDFVKSRVTDEEAEEEVNRQGGPVDNRPLYQRLEEQKLKAEEEFEKEHKYRGPESLSKDDAEMFEELERVKQKTLLLDREKEEQQFLEKQKHMTESFERNDGRKPTALISFQMSSKKHFDSEEKHDQKQKNTSQSSSSKKRGMLDLGKFGIKVSNNSSKLQSGTKSTSSTKQIISQKEITIKKRLIAQLGEINDEDDSQRNEEQMQISKKRKRIQ